MKITNRKTVDAKLLPNSYMIEMMFRCELEHIYVYNLELEGKIPGAITGYFNKRDNEIYIVISKKNLDKVEGVGAVLITEGQSGIEEKILDGDIEILRPFRAVIDELALEIYKKEHKKS